MGGEQHSVLMYGPKIELNIYEWIEIFKLIDKKEWVKNFLSNKKHTYEVPFDSEDIEGIEIVVDQECDQYQQLDILQYFLQDHSLTFVYSHNVCWDCPMIGIEVEDYNCFSNDQKNKMKEFCEKYNLPKPTFYAGIDGEYNFF